MTLTRGRRMCLEALAPPFLGSSIGILAGLAMDLAQGTSLQFLWLQRRDYLLIFFWAYLLGGLPSLGYMLIMEARFARGLDPRSWRSVGLSTLLGGGAGLLISAAILPLQLGVSFYLTVLGGTVGFVIGYLTKRLTPPAGAGTKA
jgi:hypothetical protein